MTAHQLDAGFEDVCRALSSLRNPHGSGGKKAEIRMQLGTVESTLLGTYQVDLTALLEVPVVEMTPEQLSLGEEPVTAGQPAVDEVALREQLQKIREKLDRLGPINLAAINEHQELV
jgi:chromosome segregation protein